MKRIFAPIFFSLAVAQLLSPACAEGVAQKGLKVAAAASAPSTELVIPVSSADSRPSKQVLEKKENGAVPAQKPAVKTEGAQLESPKPAAVKTEKNNGAPVQTNGKSPLPEAYSFVEPTYYGTLKEAGSEEKKKDLIALVRKGADALQKWPLAKALDAINRSPEFRKAELYLYVYDIKGTLLANYTDENQLWKNQYEDRDEFGIYPVRGLIEKALKGGGWHIYRWHHGTKIAYVMLVERDGQKYIVGGGYYPASKAEYMVGLVKAAVSTYKELMSKGFSTETVWGMFSYPLGKFMYGDLYLTVLGPKGHVLADGQRPGLVGESLWNQQDSAGAYVARTLITRLNGKQPEEGIWIDTKMNNATKKLYAERVVDAKGASVYIMSGYYPEANRNAAMDLVKRGALFLTTYGAEETGKTIARAELQGSVNTLQSFVYGDLTLFIYDMQGVCIAHGENRELVGANQSELRDEGGRFMVKEMIEKAKNEGSGWIDFRMKNAILNVYLERVDVGKESYVIGCGLYPLTKREMMTLMVKAAAEYLREHEEKKAFYDFTSDDGFFVQGDLRIFALDTTGICYAWGDQRDLIWQNLYGRTDQDGRPYVKMLINTIKRGAGILSSREHDARKVYYVEPVVKGDKTYVIGSSYYP